MTQASNRRRLLEAALAVTVSAFAAPGMPRVGGARAASSKLEGLPRLDGTLLLDDATCDAMSDDWAHVIRRRPAAVLRPKSAQDVLRIVRYANERSLRVSVRGLAHSSHGQTLAEGAILVDCSVLNAAAVDQRGRLDAQPGAIVAQLATTALGKNLIPPVLPDCRMLTLGGMLSAGLLGNTSQHHGALVDNVLELDVVTGDGRLVRCSAERDKELFEMVLGGMGQCGIVVRTRLRLVPARTHAVLQDLTYRHLDAYLADQARVATEGRFDHQYGAAIRERDGSWKFVMQLGRFFNHPWQPDLEVLQKDLRFDARAEPAVMNALDYVYRSPPRPAQIRDPAVDPASNVTMWIPASATKALVTPFLELPVESAGLRGFSFWPLNAARFTRPLFKVPVSEPVFFSMWLNRRAPRGDAQALEALQAGTRDLLAKLAAAGGKRYSPYSPVPSASEAVEHYGAETLQRFARAKAKFDPNSVLASEAVQFTPV
ncbi:MAG: FAD-binding protein [Betaproteobacteria bacterium]|nr:FAD-binding protein [Betaproteobacteria bacterium]